MTVQQLIDALQEIEDKSKICMLSEKTAPLYEILCMLSEKRAPLHEIQSVYDWEDIVEIR
jgi:hypothetical protein